VRVEVAVRVLVEGRLAVLEEVAVFEGISERVAVLVAMDERVAESVYVGAGGEGENLPATAVAARCPSKNAPATVAECAGLTCSPEMKRRSPTGACRFVRSVGELPRR